jgi:hypothetical protein
VSPAPASRRDLTPSSPLPLAYFGFAHLALATAFIVIATHPSLPGAFFYHPRMVAVVHLVTLGWLTGSILGAFYIVAPLALRLPMPVGIADWVAFAAFVSGTVGMVGHFWIGEYVGMIWAAGPVIGAIAWVAVRAWRGLRTAAVPFPIKLHVALAFVNILAAGMLGATIGIVRTRGLDTFSPIAATYAHAHLAAVGWVAMMVVGLAYRLIPMMLPAQMPSGWRLGRSAVLMEAGLVVLVVALIRQSVAVPVGAGLIVAGLASFVVEMRSVLRHRMPRPVALPPRDWSTWQAHAALLWMVVAAALGVALSVGVPAEWTVPLMWTYGVAGLVGFLAQIVTGIQGRLVPLYAWYRAFTLGGGAPPARGANELPSARFAATIFTGWTIGVPLLAWGLADQHQTAIAAAGWILTASVMAGGIYVVRMVRQAIGAAVPVPAGSSTQSGVSDVSRAH